MPDHALIDTHLHLWDTSRLEYRWLENNPLLNRPHLMQDFLEESAPVAVGGFVFVECGCEDAISEAEWVASKGPGEDGPDLLGIVAGATMDADTESLAAHLEALQSIPKVCGVRHNIQGREDGYALRESFVAGVKALPDYGFSFDLCVYHRQMKEAVELVRRCPETQFILDHMGKPGVRDGLVHPWKEDMVALAALPNTVCKVSGLTTEAADRWKEEELLPYIEHVIETFGFDRIVYGGDWPVCKKGTTYPRWVVLVERALDGCSVEEKHQFYMENAKRVYGR